MRFAINALPNILAAAAALLGMLFLPMSIRAESSATRTSQNESVQAQFRGCESAGWCRFRVEPPHPLAGPVLCVRPDGLRRTPGGDAVSIAMRDRLNVLLASMIHQHKRIVLHDLRELDDGTFEATVTVNGANLASDPILVELRAKITGTAR